MFSRRPPRWVISSIKTIIVSMVVPLLSMLPVGMPAAQAATTGTSPCVQTVGSTTGVTSALSSDSKDCIVTFTSSAAATTWTAPSYLTSARVLIVGGGASGDRGENNVHYGHGGGGGQVIDRTISITPLTSYDVSVGAGGAGTVSTTAKSKPGVLSKFGTITAWPGLGAWNTSFSGGTSGSGFLGGYGTGLYPGGGGGGAGAAADDINGGAGVISNITGTSKMYGAGGPGRNASGFGTSYNSSGTLVTNGSVAPTPTANLGQGGSDKDGNGSSVGGSAGIVVIRYSVVLSLTFDSNGAAVAPSTTSATVNLGSTITLPTVGSMVRNGYTFGGWNSAADGSGVTFAGGSTIYPGQNYSFYAVWKSTISYDPTTATPPRAIESTTAYTSQAANTLSNGKLIPGTPISSGLAFNFNAADSSSVVGNLWYDYARNGKTAVLINAPTYDAKGGYFTLDGSSQFMSLGRTTVPTSGSNSYSISVMFKASTPMSDNDAIVSRYSLTDTTGQHFIMRQRSGQIVQYWNSGYGDLNASSPFNEGEINYGTVTFDASTNTQKVYLNGVKASVAGGASRTGVGDLLIGALGDTASAGYYWAGQIYSAQGYTRALSDTEVALNYQAMIPGQLASKSGFTLVGWNTEANGSGTSYGVANKDLDALPKAYARLLPGNFRTTGGLGGYSGDTVGTTGEWINPVGETFAVTTKGSPVFNGNGGKSWGATATFPTLSGGTGDGIRLNNPILPTYTFCAVARYKDVDGVAGSKGRLMGSTSSSSNWFSGFHGSYTQKFYHGGAYLINGTQSDTNWHYYCDGGNRVSWDGTALAITKQADMSFPPFAVNYDWTGENSDWEIAEILIYDTFLSDVQINQINRYFKNTYGIDGSTTSAAALTVTTTNFPAPGNVNLYAQWGSTVTYSSDSQTSGSVPAPTLITGASGTLATNSGNLANKGFRFDGWNTAIDGSGTNYAAGGTYPNSGNVILYPKWTLLTVFPTGVINADPATLKPYMRFKAADYDASTKTWYDSSGNGRSTSLIKGTLPTVSTTGSGANGATKTFQVVAGASTTKISFDNPQLTNYTLFNVARYGGTTKGRIVQGNDHVGLFGFWGGVSGVAWHNGWLTQYATTVHGDRWVINSNWAYNYRSNGVSRVTVANAGETILRPIGVNWDGTEPSDFQIAEVIIYDRQLSLEEIKQVEDYLATTYGIDNSVTNGFVANNTYPTSKTYYVGAGAGGGLKTETLTATQGLGTKTFSISPTVTGITLDQLSTNNVAVLVSSSTQLGTYAETITVTDQTGATTIYPVNIVVGNYAKIDTATATTLATSYGKSTSLRLNTVEGVGPKSFGFITNPLSHFTLDTSSAGSGYATLQTTGFVKPGTYSVVVYVTDSTTVKSRYTIAVTVNSSPLITYPNGTVPTFRTSNLVYHYDITNSLSYSGTETRVADLVGTSPATITSSAPYSSAYSGFLDIKPSNYLGMTTCSASLAGNSMSYFLWINPRGNGVVVDERNGTWSTASIGIYSGALKTKMYGGSSSSYTLPSLNQWYYVGISYDGTTLKTYVNGNLVASVASGRTKTTANCLDVGRASGNAVGGVSSGGDFLFGALHAYGAVLTDTEVAYNYEATQKKYLLSTNKSGSYAITTTQGFAADYSLFTATQGTGAKTFALSPTIAGVTLDTSTANTAILKLGTTLASTNSTTTAVYSETMTATDTVAGVTKYDLTITVNPAITITPTTAVTLSTTVGKTVYDTFTATYGTGIKTFSGVSSGYASAFTVTNPSTNTGLLTVGSNLPAGTYTETITALDAIGATTNYVLTVVVNPVLSIAGSPSNTLTTTVTKANTLRVNVLNGTGTKRVTFTSPNSGITIDTSTVASGYATLRVETTTPVNTYSFTITATDSVNATASGTFSVVVNKWPVIGTPQIVTSNLKVNLDGTIYSGSGSWLDQSGNGKNAVLGTAATPVKTDPTYSSSSGGVFSLNEAAGATTNYMQIASPGSFETFTVSVWVKFDSLPSSTSEAAILADQCAPTCGKINYAISFTSGQIRGRWFTGASWSTDSAKLTPVINKWYNIAYSVYKSGSNYYSDMIVNGARIGAAVSAGTTAPSSSSYPVNIGKRWNADEFIDGQIGGVLIYNRALTDAEILQNFNAQGSRFLATNSGTLNFTTTEGINSSLTSQSASFGTSTKTFALAPTVSGITIDTSTANSYTLNIASTVAATDSVTARTIYETVTATDSMSATTNLAYKFVINPPIQETYTASSITTTSGIAAYDTFTATYGTGNKTFTLTGSPSTSGFTLTQANNVAVLKVEPTANPGTYYETVTATDEAGATKSLGITVVIKPGPTIIGPTTLIAAKGVAYRSPVYSVTNGNSPFTYSLTNKALSPDTNTVTGITFDTATMTLRLTNAVGSGTYVDTLTVTDAKGAKSSLVISLTVKDPISITGGSLNITKTYGELYEQTYYINNLTAAVGYRTTVGSNTDVCVPILGTVDTYTYEMLTTVGACTWIAPTGISAVDYAVAGGGGAGGSGRAGGGGGGGVAIGSALPVTSGSSYSISVGAGGTVTGGELRSNSGGNSTFANADNSVTYVAAGGGGGGGSMTTTTNINGGDGTSVSATVKSAGGSGGGGGNNFYNGGPNGYAYGNGGAPGGGSVTAYSGGSSYRCTNDTSKNDGSYSTGGTSATAVSGRTTGGGGGAGGAGGGYLSTDICPTYLAAQAPNGGAAVSTNMTGTTIYLGAGGGGSDGRGAGGIEYSYFSTGRGTGSNGGGNGQQEYVPATSPNLTLQNAAAGSAGADNSGAGGGGGTGLGYVGGSGLIVLKYPTPARVTNAIALTAISNGSSSTSGSVLLSIPENVTAGTTSKVIKVTNAGTTTSYTINITINKAIPTVTLTLPGNVTTGKYGTAVTVSAAVSTDGNVEFKDGTSVITGCESVASASGIATCSWTPSTLGSRSITAKLLPTDTTNYDSSTVTSAFNIDKADTLTVTAGAETVLYNNGSAITVTKPFTYSGLVSIDTLTAVGMIYTGTANDSTPINSTTVPTKAGTFTMTPDTSTAGISSISSNYVGVTVVAGTLTVSRIAPTMSLAYNTTNTVTYAPNLTVDTSTATRSGDGAKSFTSSSLDNCTVDSSTARISVLKAGACYITMDVAESANYLSGSILDTVTVTKATRTIALTAPVSTLKYFETTTVTTTISAGADDGLITYSLNANPGCTIDALNGLLTATSGTLACTLNASIDVGDNYESATTTNPLALTIAKANAPVITLEAIAAVDHTPGVRAAIIPVFAVTGLLGTDTASALTFTYSFISNPHEVFSYSDTQTPIDAGTYKITPSELTFSSGLTSNYETPLYASSAINFTINRIAQESVTITNVNAEILVPYYLNVTGGNNPGGALSYNLLSGNCSLSTNRLDAASPGLCVVSVTLAGNRNYLPITSDSVTVMIRNYTPIQVVIGGGSTGITINHVTPLEVGPTTCSTGCVPTITLATPDSGRSGDVITLTGTHFVNVLRVIFNVFYDAVVFSAISDTEISVEIPAGVTPTAMDGIEVVTAGGTSPRFYDFTILP